MSKPATIFTLSLLICFTLIYASGSNLAISSIYGDVTEKKLELDDENCEGVEGREKCLMRRTLVAHVDYIYTEKHKPRT
ncbi:hypothetical protein Lal_00020519 [Lupinus albus]|uniref:Phytosulfokine n=1 Tax=Lupinus albus TaxID=3870 RepID=A0A6A4Q5C7_LUPAL|nr:putative phytosulfokine [Lupinus albus]KAF1871725.1 hypothetical protein Lal_00020519 [Lupinus albus]